MTFRPLKKRGKRSTRSAVRPDRHSTAPQVVQIEKPIYGGAFLGRIEGKATFVPLALPGEQARVHIVEEKRGFASAEVDDVVVASTERTQPLCPHFGPCGGCQYQHANYDAQLRFKEAILRETLERGGVQSPEQIEVLSGQPWAYRNRIRVAFDARGNTGYRGRRSHHIVPIAECPIAAPLLVKAAMEFSHAVRTSAPGFRFSELGLFCDANETALLLSASATQRPDFQFEKLAATLGEQIPVLRGFELNLESSRGEPARRIAHWGETSLRYRAFEFDYRVDQGAFFQVNRWLVDVLIQRVIGEYRGRVAWDLFAGVGLFARALATRFDQVVAVESAPTAIAALNANLSGTSASGISASTLDFLSEQKLARPDLIIVDPPRAGLGPEVTSRLVEIGTPALTYVSCDPATLARDLRVLIAGGYSIERVTLADLFPQTFHLETVVALRRD